MTEYLVYDLKVAALLTVFYIFYRLLLDRTSLVRLNRVVLILTAVLSFVLPLCIITLHRTVLVADVQEVGFATSQPEIGAATLEVGDGKGSWLLSHLTSWVAIVVIAGTLLRLLVVAHSFYKLQKLIRNSEKHTLADGTLMAVTDEPVAPFSWMRTVVMNRFDYEKQKDGGSILAHERGHVGCHHSLDVVLVEVLTALQWFNPVVWFLRQDLRALHECEADQAVVSQGFDTDQYIYLLIRKATGLPVSSLANGMSRRMIKKRILLMKSNRRKSRFVWLRALYVVPIIAVSLIASARTVVEYERVGATSQNRSLASSHDEGIVGQTVNETSEESAATEELSTLALQKDTLKKEVSDMIKEAPAGLVVIDGEVYDDRVEELYRKGKFRAEDIDNITVLKGVSATALWGSKGKNGAVVIETKAWKEKIKKEGVDTCKNILNLSNVPVKNYHSPEEIARMVLPIHGMSGRMQRGPEMEENFSAFFARHVKYPVEARRFGVEGEVNVGFQVNADGTTSQLRLIDDERQGEFRMNSMRVLGNMKEDQIEQPTDVQLSEAKKSLAAEVLRVLKDMPKWKPALDGDGKPVATTISFTIFFKMNDKDDISGKLPGFEKHEDGSLAINGRAVKKILLDGKVIYGKE